MDSGAGGGVYRMGAACRGVMVDWMVRKSIRLNSHGHFTIPLTLTFSFLSTITHSFNHKLCNAIRNQGCATGGSGGVTGADSVDSSRTKGGFVASGEGETRIGAVNPAIRLLIAAASLCAAGVEVWETTTPCGLAGTALPDFPASTQGRQKPAAC